MTVPPIAPDLLATDRLALRRPVVADAPIIFGSYACDPVVSHFLRWPAHRDLAETEAFMADCERAWAQGGRYPFAITLIEAPQTPIGMIEMRFEGHRAEFGYVLARRLWNQGLMTEALSRLVRWSLEQPGVFRAQACCDVANPASARVMEKSGMTFEGILRRWLSHGNTGSIPRDCRMYARVRP